MVRIPGRRENSLERRDSERESLLTPREGGASDAATREEERRREHHRGWHRVVVACAVTGAAALAIGYALGDAGVLARHLHRKHHHHHRHRGRRKMHDHRESHRAHHRDDDGDDGNDRAVASPKVVVNKYPSTRAPGGPAPRGRAASLAVSSLGGARVDAAWDEALKNAPRSCAHAQYRREHDQTSMSESERALLRNVTYVSGFWRLKESHREPLAYLKGLRDTPCETGGFGMNVVFVQDSSKMCNYVMRLYHRGLQDGGKFKFGRGAATCLVMSPNEFEDVTPAGCEDDQFELHKIWYNKVGLTQRIAQKIEDGELSGDFKASHYFWLDGDIARGVVGAVGRFPRFAPVLRAIRQEGKEDKMMVQCYASEHKSDWSYANVGSSFGGSANLGLPASNGFRKCKWMRHEVISNIFGGSASALSRFRNAWIGYLNATVPTNANMGTPTAEKTCNCPSEELLFTTMANDDAYRDAFPVATCARTVLRVPFGEQYDEAEK